MIALPTTINGVSCVDEGVEETLGTNGQMVRTILCAWEDRLKLYAYFGAGTSIVGGVTSGLTTGQPYPPLPGYVVSKIHGVQEDGSKGKYVDSFGLCGSTYCRMQIIYEKTNAIGLDNGDLELDFGKEIHVLSGAGFTASSSTTGSSGVADVQAYAMSDSKSITLRVPLITIKRSRLAFTKLPLPQLIAAVIAPLNSAPIFGLPVKTVLLDGERTTGQVSFDGKTMNWNGDIYFQYRGIPWDCVYVEGDASRKIPGGWKQLTPNPYDGAMSDLNALFEDSIGGAPPLVG